MPNQTAPLLNFPELLRRDDMASLLQSALTTVDGMRRRGELPESIKIGRARYWRRNDVAAWLANRCATPSTGEEAA